MSIWWQQWAKGPNLWEVIGKILVSTQPRPLTQHLGQKGVVFLFFKVLLKHIIHWGGEAISHSWQLWRTSILDCDSWMVSCSKLWSRLSNVRLSATRDSSLQTHPKPLDQMSSKFFENRLSVYIAKNIVKCVFRPTHSCCRLCVGVRRGGTSELPLTGLRTLLYIGQDDAVYYMVVNTVNVGWLYTGQRSISFSKVISKYLAHPLVVGSVDGKASPPALF